MSAAACTLLVLLRLLLRLNPPCSEPRPVSQQCYQSVCMSMPIRRGHLPESVVSSVALDDDALLDPAGSRCQLRASHVLPFGRLKGLDELDILKAADKAAACAKLTVTFITSPMLKIYLKIKKSNTREGPHHVWIAKSTKIHPPINLVDCRLVIDTVWAQFGRSEIDPRLIESTNNLVDPW